MTKLLRTIRTQGEAALLIGLVAIWSLAWDYNPFGEFQRGGRLKVVLLAAAVVGAIRFAKTWHWSVGVFYAYVAGSYLHFNFSPWVIPINGKPFVYNAAGIEEILSITAVLFLVPILAARISKRMIENAIMGAGLIHSVIGVLNMQGIYVFAIRELPEGNLPRGLLGQQTLLGPFLAFALAIAVIRVIEERGQRAKLVHAMGAAVFLSMALLTKSSMTYASIAAGLGVIAIFHLGIWVAIVALPLSVASFFLLERFDHNVWNLSGRLVPWRDAYTLYELRPWTGFGIGAWEPLADILRDIRHLPKSWAQVHCEPLQGLAELGRLGMATVAACLAVIAGKIHMLYMFRDRARLTWIAGLAVFGVNSLANFTFHIVPHGPLFALCAYMVMRFDREDRPPEEPAYW